ncbi:MAG: hypothetical protein MK211_04520 [Flavobacteriales bacterium]|jgi:hypothetical protein|nr:hypothetical protein [Flavobacteriales bacterium]
MKLALLAVMVVTLFACCATQKESVTGFVSGTIIHDKGKTVCEFLISVSESNTSNFYDPINLEDAFKVDGLKIQFKFRPLRMKNRCSNANPIHIIELSKG